MNVKVAETAGFCFGVQRAVDRVYELIGSDAAPIYTLGPIIHNEEVVSDLEKKGVAVICEKDLGSLKGGTVVIRSHGVGRRVYNTIKKYGLGYVDVTCPFVLKIHKIVVSSKMNWYSTRLRCMTGIRRICSPVGDMIATE